MFLLDTNACIRYLNGTSVAVRERLRSTPPAHVLLSAVVVAELRFGAAHSRWPARAHERLDEFLRPYQSLPFDDRCAAVYGDIRCQLSLAGQLIGPNDLLIAATAIAHDLTLVTHNTREFGRVPNLHLEDWEV